ncbi:thioredoxin, putative [Entamoeba invadens IP1]|uniref:thioredoxin, putative n=1 Tax=Entamoeba invadens IP1 TaxID=370355 RepID=UPI0002C3D9B9|nr:thioredoxin, putative [Entamoeba invadens IP1]ELP93593.1 thioredoxin, putative [Entamoeba invadens IP1]|eukprot:XP_004260364.1 thioredoxin, putative [Entamoeba invadens IP1]
MAIIHVNTLAELDALTKEHTVIVDFFATWCGPCQLMGPIFEDLAKKHTNLKFVKVDVDQGQEVCIKYGVRSMPTFVLFKGGDVVKKFTGASKTDLNNMVNQA